MAKKPSKLKAAQPRREQTAPRGTYADSAEPGASKAVATALQGDEDRGRRQLYAAVDRLLDGPGSGDMDRWVTEVLVSLGHFVRAARLAIDYEFGRILDGVDRPQGSFRSGKDFYPAWEGAWIDVERPTADKWCQLGRESWGSPMSSETVQRALEAILFPIASTSYHPLLDSLVDALEALRFGEQRPLLKPSAKGLRSIGQAREEYRLRLRALAWAEFQIAAGRMTKAKAIEEIAGEFERDPSSIRSWHGSVAKEFGAARVNEVMARAQVRGAIYRRLKKQADDGIPLNDADVRWQRHCEKHFDAAALTSLAGEWSRLPRKRGPKEHAAAARRRGIQ